MTSRSAELFLLELRSDASLACAPERLGSEREIPGREPVRLEHDDVRVGLPSLELSRDDLLQLVHLEPVEDAGSHRLDQVARLDPRLLERVAAHERRALEHRVVELAPAPMVRTHGEDEGTWVKPSTSTSPCCFVTGVG